MKWYALVFVAIIMEGLITYIKTLIVDRKIQWQILSAMVLGVVCALAFGIDLFAVAGISAKIPYVGMVLTGILLSRGSNYIFDLVGKITSSKSISAEYGEASEFSEIFPDEKAKG